MRQDADLPPTRLPGLLGGAIAIVLLRQTGPLAVGRTILAVTAVLLALLVVWLGHVRGQRIRATRLIAGKNVVASPRTEVPLIGLATAGFAAAIVVVLVHSR